MKRELTGFKNISGFTYDIIQKLYGDLDVQWNMVALVRRIIAYPLNERISPLSETFFIGAPDIGRGSMLPQEAYRNPEEVDTPKDTATGP